MSITLDRWEIQTDGGLMPTISSDTAPALYDTAALGEKKILICEYTSTASVLNQEIYFNPALFADDALSFYPKTSPAHGWYFEANSGVTLDVYHRMLFINADNLQRNNLNFDAEVLIETGYLGFKIRLTFYMTTDTNRFIDGSIVNNLDRFIESTNDECQVSVYNSDKFILPYTYLFDPATGGGVHTEKPTGVVPIKITARDACFGLYGAVAEIDITFQLERNGEVVTNFSTYEDTDVIVCEDYENLTGSKVFVVRTNDNDQLKDFICDYSIFEPPTTTEKPSRLLLETGDFLLLESGTDKMLLEDAAGIKFTMPKEEVTEDGTYKVFAILYDDVNDIVNSCCSDEIDGLGIPAATIPVMSSEFIDFYDTFTENNYLAAPLQDLENELTIDTVAYDAAIQATLGTTSTYNDYFDSMTVEIYEENVVGDDTIKQVYERAVIKRDSTGFYVESESEGLTMTITENSLTNFQVKTRLQTRSETTPNLETQVNGARIAAPTGQQNWVGKTLKLDYTTALAYYNASLPYSDKLTHPQLLQTQNFDTGAIVAGITYEDLLGNPIQKICEDEDFCVVVETVAANLYEITGIMTKEEFAIQNRSMFHNGAGNFVLPGSTDPLISIDQFTNVVTRKGKMCLSFSELDPNASYSFGIMTKFP